MFDIGFSEIALIFTLALIVLGPEKLPKVASQVGRWIGRARGMARQFREQLEEEVNLEETRRVTRQAAATSPSPASIEPTPPAALEQAAHDHIAHDHVAHEPFSPAAMHGEMTPVATESSPAEPPQPVYPDHYSHAHPTDADGLPLPPPSPEPAVAESGQQDWVGGAVEDKPAQSSAAPGYAPPHERGT